MNRRLDQTQFLKECESIRGAEFDYTGVIFCNWKTKIEIVCKVCHHNWAVTPVNFLVNKTGCPACRNKRHKEKCNKDKLSLDQFIQKSKLIHKDVYDYSESNYTNSKSKIDIICKLHGKFQQIAYDHYNGIGCNKCRVYKILETKIRNGIIRSIDDIPAFELYKNKAWAITERSYRKYKHLINPTNLPRNKMYNLDHIFSIQQGFQFDIDPDIIGHYTNLRIMDSISNRQKHIRCDKTVDNLLKEYKTAEENI